MNSTATLTAKTPSTTEVPMDMHTPPEIMAEVLIEQIAYVCARLHDLALAAPEGPLRAAIHRARLGVRELRLAFDPHDRAQVHAMRQRVVGYAKLVDAGQMRVLTTAQ
jgi:hypothetical protein